jgi:hypothetical protein
VTSCMAAAGRRRHLAWRLQAARRGAAAASSRGGVPLPPTVTPLPP